MLSAMGPTPVVTDSVTSVSLCQCQECQNSRSGFSAGSAVFPWRGVTGLRPGSKARRVFRRRVRQLVSVAVHL